MSFVALAIGVGAAATLGGAALQASAASKAAKAAKEGGQESLQFKQEQTALADLRQRAAMRGQAGIDEWIADTPKNVRDLIVKRAAKNPEFQAYQRKRLTEIDQQLKRMDASGGAVNTQARMRDSELRKSLVAEREKIRKEAGGDPGHAGLVDLDEIRKQNQGTGLQGKYDELASMWEKTQGENLNRYDVETGRLTGQARGIERTADQYGKQRGADIRRNAGESLQNANQLATANMMGRGLGASSALTDALGANARQNQQGMDTALGQLGDEQIRLKTGLQTGRLGLSASRSSGRDAMTQGGQAAGMGFRQGALNVRLADINSPSRNPFLGENTTQYFPGVSPSAAGMATAGSGLTGAGSAVLGYGLSEWSRGNSGGGGANPNYANYQANNPNFQDLWMEQQYPQLQQRRVA